jgi:hypothetical protein
MTATDDATTPTQNLKLRQIMASFAYLAYCGQGITTPNPEAEILRLIKRAMPQIPPLAHPNPPWQVVWGPAVFTMPGALYQDNMMFVAQNQSDPSQFVIAVRGTNFVSDLDWLMEDLDILQLIPWPTAPNAAISESTSIDLQVLLGMIGKNGRGDEMCLLDFLSGQTFLRSINLCVTGHSLGGCVAGTLALYLKENRTHWDPRKYSFVCSVTFAAPTAGNAAFAKHSDQQFADQSKRFPGWDPTLGTNFDAVRCTLDVAWMSWMTYYVATPSGDSYPPLLNIYGDNLDFWNASGGSAFSVVLTQFVCPMLVDIMTPRNYQQVVPGATKLGGTFNGSPPPYDDPLKQYVEAFLEQAKYQHGSSYPILLGVPQLDDSKIIVTLTPPSSSRIVS